MRTEIDNIKKSREFLLSGVEELNLDQLNMVPEGFNNNIIWNIGHLSAALQGICYLRAGLPPALPDPLLLPFKGGTKPGENLSENEVTDIKQAFLQCVDQLATDYEAGHFTQYTAWKTRYGVEINSIEDAIKFLMYHEGLHAGTILTYKRLVTR